MGGREYSVYLLHHLDQKSRSCNKVLSFAENLLCPCHQAWHFTVVLLLNSSWGETILFYQFHLTVSLPKVAVAAELWLEPRAAGHTTHLCCDAISSAGHPNQGWIFWITNSLQHLFVPSYSYAKCNISLFIFWCILYSGFLGGGGKGSDMVTNKQTIPTTLLFCKN